uniref:Uncharacterized protein n=1 Tax=Leishmania sp. TaxID=28847 RepID=Q33590_9TRYP|nr:unnamed protein product [Leishmania sp.]
MWVDDPDFPPLWAGCLCWHWWLLDCLTAWEEAEPSACGCWDWLLWWITMGLDIGIKQYLALDALLDLRLGLTINPFTPDLFGNSIL